MNASDLFSAAVDFVICAYLKLLQTLLNALINHLLKVDNAARDRISRAATSHTLAG